MWAEKQTVPIFCLKPPRPHPERRTAKLIFKPLQCTCPFLLLCRSFPSQQRPNLLSPAGSSLFDTILYDKSLCQLDLGRKKKKKRQSKWYRFIRRSFRDSARSGHHGSTPSVKGEQHSAITTPVPKVNLIVFPFFSRVLPPFVHL